MKKKTNKLKKSKKYWIIGISVGTVIIFLITMIAVGSGSGSGSGSGGSSLPKDFLGYYVWSWKRHATDPPVTGPPKADIGITFAGANVTSPNRSWQSLIKDGAHPMTDNKINLLSVGGGGGNPFNGEDIDKYIKMLPDIPVLGYNGVCFDLESGNATIEEYKNAFKQTKDAGLIVMVTISYFAANWDPELGPIINELVQEVLVDVNYVDILSPQLYSGDCGDSDNWTGGAGGGDFNGDGPTDATREAYRGAKNLAPTINSRNWPRIKEEWLKLGLPEPIGVFQYCNTAPGVIIPTI